MKALSLWQPWASFIAIGMKSFETRSWSPPPLLIGQRIAIHAAKKAIPPDDVEWARRLGAPDLPRGAIVCTAVLAGAYQCGPPRSLADIAHSRLRVIRQVVGSADVPIVPDEFGDFADGRWAWLLTDIERFEPPVPARGAQGFWDWHG